MYMYVVCICIFGHEQNRGPLKRSGFLYVLELPYLSIYQY